MKRQIHTAKVLWWDDRHREGQLQVLLSKYYFNYSVLNGLKDIKRGQLVGFVVGKDGFIDEVFKHEKA